MIIGIGGVSRSGKTILAEQLKEELPDTVILHQDEFNAPELPMIESHIDWEIPEAVDYENLIRELQALAEDHKHVIVEGILIFANPALNICFDKRIVLTLNQSEFFDRKRKDLRWGKEPEWYITHIWESYLRFGFPPDDFSFLKLDADPVVSLSAAINYIQS